MEWYYSKNSNQLGPVSFDELRAKLASGEINSNDLVWKDGMADWVPASSVPELAALITAPAAPGGIAQPATPYQSPRTFTDPSAALIPNYLWQSIVVTILCCWPCGIPAIVYAAKVDGLKAKGDIQGAMEASANAKKWCVISLIAWVVVIVIYILFMVFVGVSAVGSAALS